MRNVRHSGLLIAKLGSHVHAQAASALSESVTLRSVFAAIAYSAVEHTLVLGNVHAVQQFIAHTAFETELVPFGTCGDAFLGGIDGLAALGALVLFGKSERHSVTVFGRLVKFVKLSNLGSEKY